MKRHTLLLRAACLAFVFAGTGPRLCGEGAVRPPHRAAAAATSAARRTGPNKTAVDVRNPPPAVPAPVHAEVPDDPPMPRAVTGGVAATSPAGVWVRGDFVSIQVNVNSAGDNVIGDAANEPSIAVDPNNPGRMAIGWRQFDTIASNFRQSGIAYSHDGGRTWTSPGADPFAVGVLEPGEFSSDPILDSDAEGRFYYYALQPDRGPGSWACYLYRSDDGGATWPQEVYAWGGDKAWMTVDRTGGTGHGNLYFAWSPYAGCCSPSIFTRSTDGGLSFLSPLEIPASPTFGTLTVGPDGDLFIVGGSGGGLFAVARSSNARNPGVIPVFDQVSFVDLGGTTSFSTGPNPEGLLGQVWIAGDHSNGPTRGNLYVVSSVWPWGSADPLDVMFSRSTDGGLTWSPPVRVNDDPANNGAWQWFGTMAVAPNGRIDVIWNDTRADPGADFSELYYSFSTDGGETWSANVPLSPRFNHFLGYPNQRKLGDYYDMVSDNFGASIAYAATFNGEQDVYYLRIGDFDCNDNGLPDADDVATGRSPDCNENNVPDECDPDCNENKRVDECEIRDGKAPDCDENMVPDECDPDFDGDGAVDACDDDIDGDGVFNFRDVCDFTPPGLPVRSNGAAVGDASSGAHSADCVVDLGDLFLLTRCLDGSGPGGYVSSFCADPYDYPDAQGVRDSDIDLFDVAGFQRTFGR